MYSIRSNTQPAPKTSKRGQPSAVGKFAQHYAKLVEDGQRKDAKIILLQARVVELQRQLDRVKRKVSSHE